MRPAARWLWTKVAGPVAGAMRLWDGLIRRSGRIDVIGEGAGIAGPAIFVHWHKHVPMIVPHLGARGCAYLVSPAPELGHIVRWCEGAGLHVVRGAAGRGGRQALALLEAELRAGRSVVIAVDGPAGPAFAVKPGCVELARATSAPIVPVGYRCHKARPSRWRWDQSLVPDLGDHIVIEHGAPIPVAPADEPNEVLGRIRAALDRIDRGDQGPLRSDGCGLAGP